MELITWSALATYGGATAMLGVLTQFVKNLGFLKSIPTQFVSYVLAFVILLCANVFTVGISVDILFQIMFNAALVSLSGNGAFTVVKSVTNRT